MHVRRIVGIALLAGGIWGLSGCETSISEKDIKESVLVSTIDVRQLVDARERGDEYAVLLIDPRAPKYFAAGHLPGARNLRLPEVPEKDAKDPNLERYGRLVVYGENPGSAVARAMFKRLLAVGYGRLKFYPGGVDEWVRSGYGLEESEPPASPDDDEDPREGT